MKKTQVNNKRKLSIRNILKKNPLKEQKKKTTENRKQKKSVMLFSIRNKIFICFIVPIIFMVIVGASAYNKASDGMTDKFKETSVQTIKMTREYLDMTNSFIKSEFIFPFFYISA